MALFQLSAPFQAMGDQPTAIAQLVQNVQAGHPFTTLFGATGTGKTFTIASMIEKVGRPTLVLAHNKTLAAQLCNELRSFFPENAVEFADYGIIRSWIIALVDSEIKAISINRKIASLKTFYKFLMRQEVISKNPMQKIRVLKTQKRLPSFVKEGDMVKAQSFNGNLAP